MQVSLAWLREILGPGNWLDGGAERLGPSEYSRKLAARLTMVGLEVESITAAGPPLGGVIVGEVISVARHPNADTLTLCQVATGRETVQVVCGARNVRTGM